MTDDRLAQITADPFTIAAEDIDWLISEVERLRRLIPENDERWREIIRSKDRKIDRVRALVPDDNFAFDDGPEDVWRFVRDLRDALDGEAR